MNLKITLNLWVECFYYLDSLFMRGTYEKLAPVTQSMACGSSLLASFWSMLETKFLGPT